MDTLWQFMLHSKERRNERFQKRPKLLSMGKLIAAINMTLDGYCDHTSMDADEEIHQHYGELLKNAETVIYGRITYQLMEFWRTLVEDPSGIKDIDEFAAIMDRTPKIVFSRTLKNDDQTGIGWDSARLANKDFKEEISNLKLHSGKDIFIGSPSLIIEATTLGLIDEFQICIHPVIAGRGLPLFKNISEKAHLSLIKTKSFVGGAVLCYYKPAEK